MQRLNDTRPLARYEIAVGSTIAPGDLVALNSYGKAVAAADTAGLRVIGVAERVQAGSVEIMDGIFSFANDTTNALTRGDRGAIAYVKDKNTVTASAGVNGIPAGIVVDVYDGEVYVQTAPAAVLAAIAAATASGSAPASGSGSN